MVSENDFQKAVELIDRSSNVLITTHARPDGDACGAIVALAEALSAMGKKITPLFLSDIPRWYEFLFVEKPKVLGRDVTGQQLLDGRLCKPDLIIIVDTNSYSQLQQFDQYLKQNDKPVLVIDHHVSGDGLGDVELTDSGAAAAAQIVFDLFKYSGWEITEKIAENLFVAIATDTGWFRFRNADAKTYRTCGQLIETGVKPTGLYHDLYQNFSRQRFELMAAMLNTLELHFDGRYATQYLRLSDFERTGAVYSDTEDLINECQRIGTVEVATLFVEREDGQVKLSLRSTGAVDVRRVAQKFGGGGHISASGAHLPGPLENAQQLVFAQIEEQFDGTDSRK